jgi:hypothetical protein
MVMMFMVMAVTGMGGCERSRKHDRCDEAQQTGKRNDFFCALLPV